MSHTQWQHRYSVENECHVYVSERSRCWCTAVWTGIEASNDFQGNNHWLGGTNLTDDPLSSSANSASVSLLQVRYGVFPFSFSFPFLLETPASELLDVYTTTIYRRQNKYTPYIRKIHRAVNQKSQVRRLLHGVWFNSDDHVQICDNPVQLYISHVSEWMDGDGGASCNLHIFVASLTYGSRWSRQDPWMHLAQGNDRIFLSSLLLHPFVLLGQQLGELARTHTHNDLPFLAPLSWHLLVYDKKQPL